MENPEEIIENILNGIVRLQKTISKKSTNQLRGSDELTFVKAFAYAWFKTQRPKIEGFSGSQLFVQINEKFTTLLEYAEHHTSRSKYKELIKNLKKSLVGFRSEIMKSPSQGELPQDDLPPDFSGLIHDEKMRGILIRRWEETQKCLSVEADLSATVMMGGLLEALLLARVNILYDKSVLFKCQSAPFDTKENKKRPLQEWTLKDYIDVAHELKWIRQSARDVGVVLRDYRNYIHPAKELSHGIQIVPEDSKLFWSVFKSLANQILDSASN